MLREVVLDFETASACDLKKSGAWRYAEDPTTEILCLVYTIIGEARRVWTPDMGLDPRLLELAEDPEVFFIAHNAGFEKAIWRCVMVPLLGFPNVRNNRWHDTMAMCAMRVIPQQLEHGAKVLGLAAQKDMEGSRLTKSLSKPNKKGYYDRSPATLARVISYCTQDIDVEENMHKRLGYLPPGERDVWLLDQRINERGIRIDLPLVAAMRRVVSDASVPLLGEFRTLTGGLKPTQRDKFMGWIVENGFSIPNMTKDTLAALLGETEDGEEYEYEEGDEWYGDVATMPANVRRALSIRQLIGSSSISKLERMELCAGHDGRARGLLQYHGAGPGRWAGRLLQPHNFPRGTLKLGKKAPKPDLVVQALMTRDYQYVETMFGPAVECVVSALRHTLIPAPKRKFVVGDFAGIEARVVLALAGQHDKTALMASGADVYLDMAEEIYKAPKGSFNKDENPKERQTGKNSVLGLGFQMGAPKFRLRYAPEQPIEFAKMVVDTYRKDWAPEVPKLWRALEQAAIRAVWDGGAHEAYGVEYKMDGEWLTARLPSGRRLWYFHPEKTRKEMPWSTREQPDVRCAWSYRAMKMGRWVTIDAFGGLLTENVVQALARDLLCTAMFKCEQNGLPIALTVHDEIVAEPDEVGADVLALEQIMCDSPDWARAIRVPVATECWAGDRYKK